jgi:hypothetical protein
MRIEADRKYRVAIRREGNNPASSGYLKDS